MGSSYFYVNHDKAQFFNCGLFGSNDRYSQVGVGWGSRALGILLSDLGTWKGDRISVMSDEPPEFDALVRSAIDIEVEAELMLVDVDGLDWLEPWLDSSIGGVFDHLCSFALLLRRADVTALLDRKFGVGKWQHRYKKHLQTQTNNNTDFWSQKVIDAKYRALK